MYWIIAAGLTGWIHLEQGDFEVLRERGNRLYNHSTEEVYQPRSGNRVYNITTGETEVWRRSGRRIHNITTGETYQVR